MAANTFAQLSQPVLMHFDTVLSRIANHFELKTYTIVSVAA